MDISSKLLELITGGNEVARIVFSVVFLLIGFFLLMKGADIFVDGASKVAEKLKVPLIIIGLTIVAFGTSAPEAAISINSAVQNNAGIAIGNVVGSNIMNILLILGISSLFANLPVKSTTLKMEIPFVVFISLVLLGLGVLGWDLNWIDGIILLILFALFFVYLIFLSKKSKDIAVDEVPTLTEKDTGLRLFLLIVAGLVMIILGSDVTVCGAKVIAEAAGVSERIIGLTVVAFGTSLPELVTSVAAARKGKTDIAVGNIIGSNIFNILFILGAASIVSPSPIVYSTDFVFDTIMAAVAAVILFVTILIGKKSITKVGGGIMLVSYAAYLVYLFVK